MRIGTHNVNGIRAALRRGFTGFWEDAGTDVIALQEVRCRVEDLPDGAFGPYHAAWDAGTLAGRNGVAVLTRSKPARIRTLGDAGHVVDPEGRPEPVSTERISNRDLAGFAHEGRYIEVDLADAPLRVASLYLPKGAAWPYEQGEAAKAKYDRKMTFLRGMERHLVATRREAAREGREFVILGDFNIAHTKQDLKNWRGNQKSEGFLPEERAWLDGVIGPRRLVDVVRHLHPEAEGPYSWWSWRGQAFTNDSGWRIDYHLASPNLAKAATAAWSAREDSYQARISDHCPVIADYDLTKLPTPTV